MTTFVNIDQRQVPITQYTTPATGATLTANDGANLKLIINPAGTILALTLALNASPADGDILSFCSSQAVTGFTMTGGTIVGPLTTLAIGTFASYIYNGTATKWFRIG